MTLQELTNKKQDLLKQLADIQTQIDNFKSVNFQIGDVVEYQELKLYSDDAYETKTATVIAQNGDKVRIKIKNSQQTKNASDLKKTNKTKSPIVAGGLEGLQWIQKNCPDSENLKQLAACLQFQMTSGNIKIGNKALKALRESTATSLFKLLKKVEKSLTDRNLSVSQWNEVRYTIDEVCE
jgi:hypothetical protein